MNKFCKNCGTKIRDGEKKCSFCGAKTRKNYLPIILIVIILFFCFFCFISGGILLLTDNDYLKNLENDNNNTAIENNDSDKLSDNTKDKPDKTDKSDEVNTYTAFSIYESLGKYTYNISINENAEKFLKEKSEWFLFDNKSTLSKEDVEEKIDYKITWDNIKNDSSKYGDKLIDIVFADITGITEYEIDEEHNYTIIDITDQEGNEYKVYYLGKLTDLNKGDIINIIGLPINYSNSCLSIAGCIVEEELNTTNKNIYTAYNIYESNSLRYYRTQYHINKNVKKFLIENPHLFLPEWWHLSDDKSDLIREDVEKNIDYNITWEDIREDDSKYGNKLMFITNAKITSIAGRKTEDEHSYTIINITDTDNNEYEVYYLGELTDLHEGDTVNITGLPICCINSCVLIAGCVNEVNKDNFDKTFVTEEYDSKSTNHQDPYSVIDYWMNINVGGGRQLIGDNQKFFLQNNPEFFPVANQDTLGSIEYMIDTYITYDDIEKNPYEYGDKLMHISATVIKKSEFKEYKSGGNNIQYTEIHLEADGRRYAVCCICDIEALEHINVDDEVSVVGLPLIVSDYDYENMEFGHMPQPCLYLAGSLIL